MPNDPYSNFIPMQSYLAANPEGADQFEHAAAAKAAANPSSAYNATGNSQEERYQHTASGYTPGMSALDDSLESVEHPYMGRRGLPDDAPPKPSKQGQGDPGDPDYTPGKKAPGTNPPGKQGNDPGQPGMPGGGNLTNSSPFNPMMAQLQMIMQMNQPQEPEPGKKKVEEG